VANRFLVLPIAFDLVTMFVEPAASVAVGEYVRVIILKRLFSHQGLSF
jgi:hypothetical protein